MTAEMIGYVATVLMGISLGMLGSGGSIFTVPILVYLFAMNPESATTHSLLIVGVSALIGGTRYATKGLVHVKTLAFFAVPGFLGIVGARHYVLPWLPDPIFVYMNMALSKNALIMVFFSILMLMAAVSMFSSGRLYAEHHSRVPPFLVLMFRGVMVGFVTGLAGIGGGFLIVPALVRLVDLPLSKAIGTSMFIIAANALFGFSISSINGAEIDLPLTGSVLSAAVVGLVAGFLLSKIILEDILKKTFAVFVLVIGLCILGDQIMALFSALL